jgi:ribosomal protein S19
MSRSVWKVPYISRIFFSNISKKGKFINITQRNVIISMLFIDKKVFVYDGYSLCFVEVKANMLGYKFGEFVFTKVFNLKSLKTQKKN